MHVDTYGSLCLATPRLGGAFHTRLRRTLTRVAISPSQHSNDCDESGKKRRSVRSASSEPLRSVDSTSEPLAVPLPPETLSSTDGRPASRWASPAGAGRVGGGGSVGAQITERLVERGAPKSFGRSGDAELAVPCCSSSLGLKRLAGAIARGVVSVTTNFGLLRSAGKNRQKKLPATKKPPMRWKNSPRDGKTFMSYIKRTRIVGCNGGGGGGAGGGGASTGAAGSRSASAGTAVEAHHETVAEASCGRRRKERTTREPSKKSTEPTLETPPARSSICGTTRTERRS